MHYTPHRDKNCEDVIKIILIIWIDSNDIQNSYAYKSQFTEENAKNCIKNWMWNVNKERKKPPSIFFKIECKFKIRTQIPERLFVNTNKIS